MAPGGDRTSKPSSSRIGTSSGLDRLAIAAVVVTMLGLSLVAGKQPVLGVVAFIACCAVIAVARSGAVAVCAFVATLYFEIITVYTGTAASPVKLAGGGLIALSLLTLAVRTRRSAQLRRSTGEHDGSLRGVPAPGWNGAPIVVALAVAFTAWALTSAAWATSVGHVKEFGTRLVTDTLIFLAVPVLLVAVRHLRMLAWSLLACACGAIITGIALGAELAGRAIGTFADPNEFAAALIPAIAFGLVVGESSELHRWRWVARGLAAFGMFGVLASGSRGGLLAVAVAFLVLLITARGAERLRMSGVLTLALAAGSGWLLLTPAGEALQNRIFEAGSSGRSDLWKVAIYEWQDHPVTGVGLGNYPVLSRRYIEGNQIANSDLFLGFPKVVHSTPLEVLAELGLVGIVLYYGFILGSIGAAARALRAARSQLDASYIPVGRGVLAASLSLLATTAFLSGHYNELSWVLAGCCIAYAAMVRAAVRHEEHVLPLGPHTGEDALEPEMPLDVDGAVLDGFDAAPDHAAVPAQHLHP